MASLLTHDVMNLLVRFQLTSLHQHECRQMPFIYSVHAHPSVVHCFQLTSLHQRRVPSSGGSLLSACPPIRAALFPAHKSAPAMDSSSVGILPSAYISLYKGTSIFHGHPFVLHCRQTEQ